MHAPAWRRSGPAPQGLGVLAQEDLPVAIEALHLLGLPLGDGDVLVAGALRAELATLTPAERLSPASGPPGIDAPGVADLNFLSGSFEPAHLRRARLNREYIRAAMALLIILLVSIGFVRRAGVAEVAAGSARTAWAGAAQARTPADTDEVALFQLRRAAMAARSAAALPDAPDAAPMLAEILAAWPKEVVSRPQSISIEERAAVVSVLVDDAAKFLAQFHPPAGWQMDQPMLNAAGDAQRLVVTLRRRDPTS